MKFRNVLLFVFGILFFQNSSVYSQESPDDLNLIVVREDRVNPSLSSEYELFLAQAKAYLEENKINNFNYFTLMQDNYMFRHVVPIKSLSEIDNTTHGNLSEKLNDPELDLILDLMNTSIISTKQIVLKYQPNLSYIPAGNSWSETGNYRKWGYYYFYPGTEDEIEKILKSWKQLYENKGAEMGFRVFTSILGEEKPLYIFTTWGENPLKYQENLNKISKQLGDEGVALWVKMMEYVRETKNVEGWFLPQYSHTPGIKYAE